MTEQNEDTVDKEAVQKVQDNYWKEKLKDGSLREEAQEHIKNMDKSKLLSEEQIIDILKPNNLDNNKWLNSEWIKKRQKDLEESGFYDKLDKELDPINLQEILNTVARMRYLEGKPENWKEFTDKLKYILLDSDANDWPHYPYRETASKKVLKSMLKILNNLASIHPEFLKCFINVLEQEVKDKKN